MAYYWFIGFGFVLLAIGSSAALRGGARLACALGFSPLAIGLLVIPAATSAPELLVSLRALSVGAPDLAVGGIIGGTILTLLFVLGFGALIHPLASSPKVVFRDGGALLVAGLAFALFAGSGTITWHEGILFLVGFAVYIALAMFTDWRRTTEHSVPRACAQAFSGKEPTIAGGLFLLTLGIVAILLGAHLTIAGSIVLARELKLPVAFAGLTVVAASVSLPELGVVMAAVLRRRSNLAVGHILSANVFGLLCVVAIMALIAPVPVSHMLMADVAVMVGAIALLLPLLAMRWQLSRPRGLFLILCYGGYLVFLAARQGWLPLSLLPWIG